MWKSSIADIVDDAQQVTLTMIEDIPTENGILDKHVLGKRKEALMSFAMKYLQDFCVKEKQAFPSEETTKVELSVDFVVIDGQEYRRLRRIIDNKGL